MTKLGWAAWLLIFIFIGAASRTPAQVIPFTSTRWDMQAKEHKLIEHLGRPTLYLKGGCALIKDTPFTDGVIEFDVAFGDEQGFMGAVWRWQDAGNFEDFYLRPPHSGHADANQYQPYFNGLEAWQLYAGAGYGAAVKYEYHRWTPVKIVVAGRQAEVYIDDMTQPALFISELKREIKAGLAGLRATNFAPGYYSNFRVTVLERPPLKGKPLPPPVTPPGMVMSWQVSDAFDGQTLANQYELNAAHKQSLRWHTLAGEAGGLANLARVQGVQPNRNTAFARLVIESEREQVKKLRYGYSDAVRIYCNDRLLHGGSNVFRSRDEHFMGTLGLHDEVYLPLRKGTNEVWLAVTENFGGWGVLAQFENLDGIELK